ncbi:hypothetical protein CHARACLAT_011982 [Characodon lateralis]|uniref:Uncharacterized protein n=1 Tax=Characodon lateralis TaxID=208331 RepID=A0ABU7ET73_9TELE|nr:hypothetical protein [Characodon lateralis]
MVPIEFLLIHESVVSVKLLPGRIGSCECVWEFGRRLSSFLVNAVAQLPVNVYQVTKLCLVLFCCVDVRGCGLEKEVCLGLIDAKQWTPQPFQENLRTLCPHFSLFCFCSHPHCVHSVPQD